MGVNFITGYNGIGKTSLLESIIFALMGRVRNKDLSGFKRLSSRENTEVILQFDNLGESYEIKRTFNGNLESVMKQVSTNSITKGKTNILNYIENIFESNQNFIENIIFSSEGEVYEFLQLDSKKLVKYMEKIIGIGRASEFKKVVNESNKNFIRDKKKNENYLKLLLDFKKEKEIRDIPKLENQKLEFERKSYEINELIEIKGEELGKVIEKENQLHNTYNEYRFLSTRLHNIYLEDKLILIDLGLQEFNKQDLINRRESLISIVDKKNNEIQIFKREIKSLERKEIEENIKIKEKNRIKSIREKLESEFDTKLNIPCPICQKSLSINEYLKLNKDFNKEFDDSIKTQASIAGKIKYIKDRIGKIEKDLEIRTKFLEVLNGLSSIDENSIKNYEKNQIKLENEKNQINNSLKSYQKQEADINNRLIEINKFLSNLKLIKDIENIFRYETDFKNNLRGSIICEIILKSLEKIISEQRNINLRDLILEIQKVWKVFFPDDERELRFDSKYLPYFRLNNRSIPFENISGGEKMILLILVKTLLLKMYTKITFLILDEPLEHLDLENRINLIEYFIDLYKKGLINQLIITTFEESLTRKYFNNEDVNIISLPSIKKYKL